MNFSTGTPQVPNAADDPFAGRTPPPVAPLLFRTAAFLADSVLAIFASAAALKFLLPVFCPNGFSVFADYLRKFHAAYESAIADAARGNAAGVDALNAVAESAAQDATLLSFFETAYAISFVVSLAYFVLSEQFMRGQTLGKKIFGLRTVVFGTTLPPPFLLTLSRSFWKAVSVVPTGWLLTLVAVVNAHVVVFSRRRRGWHDKLARTEVIDARRLQNEISEK